MKTTIKKFAQSNNVKILNEEKKVKVVGAVLVTWSAVTELDMKEYHN